MEALFLIPDCTETFSLEIYPCFIKHISAMFVAACISMYCISLMSFDPQQSFADLLLYMIVAISVFTGLVCLFYI